jgi:uncharacterized membrane protein YfcA
MNSNLVLVFSLIGAAGSLLGKRIGSNFTNEGQKQGFAIFLVGMGGYIIYMNI